jgi:superfamily II DNA or RNA helicase
VPELRPYQAEALEVLDRRLEESPDVLLQAATGAGKCLAPGTPVLRYDGRVSPVEALAVGDLLMGPDSLPRRIVSLASGEEEMYMIIPVKGEPFTVNGSHVLSLRMTGEGGARKAVAPGGAAYLPGEIADIPVNEYLAASKTFKHVAKGFRAGLIEFPPLESTLPVPPYILGVWLGDGNSRGPEICNVDFEVTGAWEGYADAIGHGCRRVEAPGKAAISRFNGPASGPLGRGHRRNLVRNALDGLGLWENKHVPHHYKTALAPDRLELLAGIIDTDGYLCNNCYDLCLKHRRLAEDTAFVARSLGLAAYVTPAMKTCANTGARGEYFRISVSGDIDRIPCRVKRRIASPRLQRKNVLNFGFDVRPEGPGRYFGFELEGPDGRFLLGDFTVTHNTVIFAELIRRLVSRYPAIKVGVMAHRQELIFQARDKILAAWPEGEGQVGLACASAGPVDTGRPVTVGSVQTMARRRFDEPFDLLIVDEAHHIPFLEFKGKRGTLSQYHKVISAHRAASPGMRVLGVTATPYRLNHGYIYGDRCREGRTNPFPALDFMVSMEGLVEAGYLCPVRFKVPVDMAESLAGVGVRHGEYDERALGEMMSQPLHLSSALDAYGKYGEGRGKALVFAVTIGHARALADVLSAAGPAAAVHHMMDRGERAGILEAFARGGLRFLVNVGILTEGWDSPAVDLILMCRPTKSPGLYVQMVGRGTRPSPGKADLLVLDLADNHKAHGDPSEPRVRVGREAQGDAPEKICPRCKELVALSAKACPACGFAFEAQDDEDERGTVDVSPELVEIGHGGRPARRADGPADVLGWAVVPHVSAAGNRMARVDVYVRGRRDPVRHYLDFEGAASAWGQARARVWWVSYADPHRRPPDTVNEAVSRARGELRIPDRLAVGTDANGYRRITEWSS